MPNVEKTCFVIIGFGPKTDPLTGRLLDLDKTFDYIIKPVFEELGFICFRASDIKHSGVIDIPMYESILKSDFVLADLSTLNANVLYELGIRHAVRKNTTIVISEKELKYPFDLSHIVIEPYEHLGKAIDFGEVLRMRNTLKEKILELQKSPKVDSPLYTFFPQLEVPRFTQEEVEEIKQSIDAEGSLSDIMTAAEKAKDDKNYDEAIKLLGQAKAFRQDNALVIQRLALVTYKSEKPDPVEALRKAESILEELNPVNTTDLETLGLAGAINKRLHEKLGDSKYLKKALWFYEKGYYIGSDYYTGINMAFMYNVLAVEEDDRFEAFANYGNAARVRRNVLSLCLQIVQAKSWEARDDKQWVYFTMAEAYFALGFPDEEEKMIEKAKAVAKGEFSRDSYDTQRRRLAKLLQDFKDKHKM